MGADQELSATGKTASEDGDAEPTVGQAPNVENIFAESCISERKVEELHSHSVTFL